MLKLDGKSPVYAPYLVLAGSSALMGKVIRVIGLLVYNLLLWAL